MKSSRRILVGLIAATVVLSTASSEAVLAQLNAQPPWPQDVRYHTLRPYWQLEEREQEYTVRRPIYETTEREERYMVRRPVYETTERAETYSVRRPVIEVTEREVATTVYEPVAGQRAVRLGWNHWTVQPVTTYVPRLVVQKVPQRTIRLVEEQHVRKVPVRTVRYVEEQRVRKVPLSTVRYVEEQSTRTVKVPVLHWVEEETVAVRAVEPLIVRGQACVPGQPVRNLLRTITP